MTNPVLCWLPVFSFAQNGGGFSPILGVAFLSWNGIFPGICYDSNKITISAFVEIQHV